MKTLSQITLAIFLSLSAANVALSFDKNSSAAINVDANSVAVQGYDVVSYFAKAAPEKGKAMFSAQHQSATYYFANEIHRDAFVGNPGKYAPQFGGFCAMGIALTKKLDADPTAWKIVDGKLYLNLNADIQGKWVPDMQGNIGKANMLWEQVKAKAPNAL